jgi:hypothetical protein
MPLLDRRRGIVSDFVDSRRVHVQTCSADSVPWRSDKVASVPMKHFLLAIALTYSLVLHPRPLAARTVDVDRELVKTAAAGNGASINIIERYYAKVLLTSKATVAGKETTPLTHSCEYWRTGQNYRIRSRVGSTMTEVEREREKVRFLVVKTKDEQPDFGGSSTSMIISGRDRRCVDADPWELSLFSLPVGISSKPPLRIYDLAGLVETGTVTEAGWVILHGRKAVHVSVDLTAERRSYEVWAAPDYNWALVKVVHKTVDERGAQEWLNEYQVDEFTEIAQSVYVPTRAYINARFKDATYEASATLADIVVNRDLPPAPKFVLPPAGLTAFDESNGTTFRVNAKGTSVSKVRKLGEWYSPPVPAATQTGSYWSGAGWTTVGLAALLFFTGAVKAWGRRGSATV